MAREMKDSGIEWIGKIPNKWKRTYLLNLLKCSITDGPHETPNYVQNGIPFISVDSLNDTENVNLDIVKKFISNEDYDEYNKKTNLKKGDILFSKSATIGKTAIVDERKYMVWSPLAVIKCNDKYVFNKYIYYVLNCNEYIISASNLGTKNTQINVGMRSLEKSYIPVPPLLEQRRIANFLDEKVKEIDEVIKKTKETIELYKKYKKNIIYSTIKNGVENAKLKKTNSKYWPEISEECELVKIKRIFEITKRIAGKEGYSILSITQSGIKEKDISKNEGQVAANYSNYQLVYPGDFAMNHMDLLTGWVDISNFLGVTSPDYRVFKLRNKNNHDPRYWLYVMQTCYSNKIFYSLARGVSTLGRWRLQADAFNNFEVPVMPLKKQKLIADYLDDTCEKIDIIIAEKERLNQYLDSYKKSLIYEYVTGKKEVK